MIYNMNFSQDFINAFFNVVLSGLPADTYTFDEREKEVLFPSLLVNLFSRAGIISPSFTPKLLPEKLNLFIASLLGDKTSSQSLDLIILIFEKSILNLYPNINHEIITKKNEFSGKSSIFLVDYLNYLLETLDFEETKKSNFAFEKLMTSELSLDNFFNNVIFPYLNSNHVFHSNFIKEISNDFNGSDKEKNEVILSLYQKINVKIQHSFSEIDNQFKISNKVALDNLFFNRENLFQVINNNIKSESNYICKLIFFDKKEITDIQNFLEFSKSFKVIEKLITFLNSYSEKNSTFFLENGREFDRFKNEFNESIKKTNTFIHSFNRNFQLVTSTMRCINIINQINNFMLDNKQIISDLLNYLGYDNESSSEEKMQLNINTRSRHIYDVIDDVNASLANRDAGLMEDLKPLLDELNDELGITTPDESEAKLSLNFIKDKIKVILAKLTLETNDFATFLRQFLNLEIGMLDNLLDDLIQLQALCEKELEKENNIDEMAMDMDTLGFK